MSKATKVVLAIMICIIVAYIGVGVFDKYKDFFMKDVSKNSDVQSTNEKTITYYLTSGDNDITLTAYTDAEITKTKYIYNDENKIERIEVIEEVETDEIAKKIFDKIKTDSNINQMYSEIKIEGSTVIMCLKQDYIDYNNEFTREELYKKQEEIVNNNK